MLVDNVKHFYFRNRDSGTGLNYGTSMSEGAVYFEQIDDDVLKNPGNYYLDSKNKIQAIDASIIEAEKEKEEKLVEKSSLIKELNQLDEKTVRPLRQIVNILLQAIEQCSDSEVFYETVKSLKAENPTDTNLIKEFESTAIDKRNKIKVIDTVLTEQN